jgi:hypothetical protein
VAEPRPNALRLGRAADGAQEILSHLAGTGQFFKDRQTPELGIEVDIMRKTVSQKLHVLLTTGEFGALRQKRHKCAGEVSGVLLLHSQGREQRLNVAI